MPPLTVPVHMGRRQPKRLGRAGRWIKRVLALLVIAAGATEIVSLWRSGDLPERLAAARATAIVLSADAGFRVEEVDVMGRDHTDPRTLLAAAGLKRGDPIFSFDPEEARERIESLPWVASAAVERRLPNDVTITLVERKPIALWQHNERISLIAADGATLGAAAVEAYPDLPLVVGGDAPIHASELLRLLAGHPDIAKRIESSSWIGSRRWNLRMDNGVEVMLPEDGLADAIQQLADAEASTRLLERDVVALDLRLPGKMIVRLGHEPVTPKPVKPQQGI
jgi:cell division protein FtsQ